MKVINSLILVLCFFVLQPSLAMGNCIKGDCKDGQGTYSYADDSVYVGQWKDNKRNGMGTLTRTKGSKYVGQWKDDQFNGHGTYIYPDGSSYVGQWRDSRKNGEGRYISSDGSEYEGQWKNGRLIGKGILTTPNGKKFVGQFDTDGKLVGKYLPLGKNQLSGSPESRATAKKTFTGPNGMIFIYISPGSFVMGSPEEEKGRYKNETQHKVTITHGFYLTTTEVTQGQWEAVMGNIPSHFKKCGYECPVDKVSWDDVQLFIQRLNLLEGTEKYRLPTEAEWEYACRAGNNKAFASGGITELECKRDNNLDAVAWYCGNSNNTTHPVAQKKPNAFGLYDMHGNVSELCEDWYAEYPTGQISDPRGPVSGTLRTIRGGGWDANARHCRSACRGAISPGERSYGVGFRLAKTP